MRLSAVRLILAAVAALAAADPVSAQSLTDTGKKKLAKLFAEATSAATRATVRIKCDGRDAIQGTVVSEDGYILTKGSELRGDISCVMQDGSAYEADYVGYHKASDLALIKVDAKGLSSIKMTTDTAAVVGNWVAITGMREEPIAVGVVSSAARKLYNEQATIENANKGYMGILLEDPEEGSGVLIKGVTPGAAAAKAGLKAKDIIFEVAGKAVKNRDGLLTLMETYRPGDLVAVKVKRGEESVDLKVKLSSRGDFNRGDFQNAMGGTLSGRRTGFPSVIQHDTVVRPGDCGGPLVDLNGKVLGINIARAGRVETWTIPTSVVAPILKELKDGKYPVSK